MQFEATILNSLREIKIQLAVLVEKLAAKGQNLFARHIETNLSIISEETGRLLEKANGEVVKLIINCLQEIENVLLACKLGVDLEEEVTVLSKVRFSKVELQRIAGQH